jgi:hypothetical protein
VPNKATREAREIAARLVDDPEYQRRLRQRLLDGELPPAIEVMLWHYAKGKPKDVVEVSGGTGGPHLAGMEMLARANASNLPPLEHAQLMNTVARMFDTYANGTITLQKLKSGGRQVVIVQYQQVNVGAGGKALVAGRVPGARGGRGGWAKCWKDLLSRGAGRSRTATPPVTTPRRRGVERGIVAAQRVSARR